MIRGWGAVAIVIGGLTGCVESDPRSLAAERGLVPPVVHEAATMARPINPTSRFGQMIAAIGGHSVTSLPTPPPTPNIRLDQVTSSYQGWETDRIDASTYDALTSSVNDILHRMGEPHARNFDRIFKYVMLQVTKSPMVAQKAANGEPMSDAELLAAIRGYVHGRTPRQITEMAERLQSIDQATAGRSGPGMGRPSVFP